MSECPENRIVNSSDYHPDCPSCASMQATLDEWKRLHACPKCATKDAILEKYRRLGYFQVGTDPKDVLCHMQRIAEGHIKELAAKDAEIVLLQTRLAEAERDLASYVTALSHAQADIAVEIQTSDTIRADLAATRAVLRRVKSIVLCHRTNHPWGTDTMANGSRCLCPACVVMEDHALAAALEEGS